MTELLAECAHFRTERLRVNGSVLLPPRARNTIFVAMAGQGDIAGIPFQAGVAIEVPAGNRRGEKLRPGDEIYLGRACLRFDR